MLNGVAPIFIFSIPVTPKLVNPLSGKPTLLDKILSNVGIPIPIYLDEKLTGIYVTSEDKSIDIDQATVAYNAGGTGPFQSPIDSMVTINLVGIRDSTALMVLLALCDFVYARLQYGYSITYLNGSTTVFAGLLKTFVTNTPENTDKITIQIQLSKSKGNSTVPSFNQTNAATPSIDAVPGTVSSGATGGGVAVPKPLPAVPIGNAG